MRWESPTCRRANHRRQQGLAEYYRLWSGRMHRQAHQRPGCLGLPGRSQTTDFRSEKNGVATHREFLVRKKMARFRGVKFPALSPRSGRQVLIWVLRDIHARWEIAQALRHRGETPAFHLLPDTLMLSDLATGAIVDLNGAGTKSGHEPAAAIGHSLIELGLDCASGRMADHYRAAESEQRSTQPDSQTAPRRSANCRSGMLWRSD